MKEGGEDINMYDKIATLIKEIEKGKLISFAEIDKAKYEYSEIMTKLSEINDNSETIQKIWVIINNYKYFADVRSRTFNNMIHDIAREIDPEYETIGEEYIESQDALIK